MLKKQKNICLLCSMGCGFIIETRFDEAVNLEYDSNDPVGKGALCGKGNYMLELLNHPMRFIEPRTEGRAIDWKDALIGIAGKLVSLKRESSAGLILGGDASVEDAALAKLFAEKCLNNGRFAVHFATADDEVCRALAASSIPNPPANLEEIEKSGCTIAVGDPFEVGPVIAGRVLTAKYVQKKSILAVVSEKPNRTSRFASVHLGGSERKTLIGLLRAVADKSGNGGPGWKDTVKNMYPASKDPEILNLSDKFVNTPSAVMILETQDPITAQLAAMIVAAAGADKRLYCINSYGNAGDICDVTGADGSVEEIIDSANSGELKVLIVLGADPARGVANDKVKTALKKVDYLVAGAPFENETSDMAKMILPTSLWLEADGTFNGKKLTRVIEPPGGALSYGEILHRLADEMKCRLPDISVETVLKHEEPTPKLLESLLKDIEGGVEKPEFCSSTLRFGDGSLTDNMSWITSQERESW